MFGGRSDSCILGDKKTQNESSRALHSTWLISLNTATATECDKKAKGDADSWTSEHKVLDRVRNIFYKFHVKIKFSSKGIAHEIRGTNFWDTL